MLVFISKKGVLIKLFGYLQWLVFQTSSHSNRRLVTTWSHPLGDTENHGSCPLKKINEIQTCFSVLQFKKFLNQTL